MADKELLRQRFSSKPDTYYRVQLFDELGYLRKKCSNCGKYFWTLNQDAKRCPDQPCQPYGFLNNPPTHKRMGYSETWRVVEDFFVKHGHRSIRRYPVVCRWRPDLYFTVASIIDFQRVEAGKVVFEFPANPLIVPQMCLRFNDISNVGVTGRHYTGFCMIGQHSIQDGEGYWKDRCIELDHHLLTDAFGIPADEVVYVEDVWLGYGAFGYSLEYFVRGLELGNAVFTAFEGTPDSFREMERKVVDMGAGLERFVWLTNGDPTSYESVFGPVARKIMQTCNLEYDHEFMSRFGVSAGLINFEDAQSVSSSMQNIAYSLGMSLDDLQAKLAPISAAYSVADHVRSLCFAIADGFLPSNVGGGYNLRVILRRALNFIEEYGWKIDLEEVADWHIAHLREIYPELHERREDIRKILGVERSRHEKARDRIDKLIGTLRNSEEALGTERLVELYDSQGVSPETLRAAGLQVVTPPDFYERITSRHEKVPITVEKSRFDVSNIPPTRLLFYEDKNLREFQAMILDVSGNAVILDQTAFYARSGGQEPDHGMLGEAKVIDVNKIGSVVVHTVSGPIPQNGSTVRCKVDDWRRKTIMKHHTATHIVNGAVRSTLGSWVWQHSAFKDVDKARLDVTHYAHLSDEEISKIERLANETVRKNLPVSIELQNRSDAEQRFGFRLYQGGVVPGREVRVVKIDDFDVEACGGTHCSTTGEVGFIKITKSERIQDGVERLEFVAGEKAGEYFAKIEKQIQEISKIVNSPTDRVVDGVKRLRNDLETLKILQKNMERLLVSNLPSRLLSDAESVSKIRAVFYEGIYTELDIAVGEALITLEDSAVFCGVSSTDDRRRLVVFSGSSAQKRGITAREVMEALSKKLKGSGGGDKRFAQGGVSSPVDMKSVRTAFIDAIKSLAKK